MGKTKNSLKKFVDTENVIRSTMFRPCRLLLRKFQRLHRPGQGQVSHLPSDCGMGAPTPALPCLAQRAVRPRTSPGAQVGPDCQGRVIGRSGLPAHGARAVPMALSHAGCTWPI